MAPLLGAMHLENYPMIRSTLNASTKTVTRSILGQTYEVVFGSSNGILPDASAEIREIDVAGLDVGNTYTIVPSNEHNPIP